VKIGELSRRTGIPTRMLRYYEQQGLLDSERAQNGYRSYDEADVDQAMRVRGLIQSGLSTRMARVVLDLERRCDADDPPVCTRALAEELAAELVAIQSRLSCLQRSRDAVARYLKSTEFADLVPTDSMARTRAGS